MPLIRFKYVSQMFILGWVGRANTCYFCCCYCYLRLIVGCGFFVNIKKKKSFRACAIPTHLPLRLKPKRTACLSTNIKYVFTRTRSIFGVDKLKGNEVVAKKIGSNKTELAW